MILLFVLAWLLPAPVGHVDRVEGAYAVVLWSADDAHDVPLCLFDGPVSEGDAVRLRVHPARHGPWLAGADRLASAADPSLDLPLPPGARPGRRYRVRLAAAPGPARSPLNPSGALAGSASIPPPTTSPP